MEHRRFAMLDDTISETPRIKVVDLYQRRVNNGYEHIFRQYRPVDETVRLPFSRARYTDINLKQFTVDSMPMNIWRTAYTVCHMGTWLPILDCEDRDMIPGEFDFTSDINMNLSVIMEQLNLRLDVIKRIYGDSHYAEAPASAVVPVTVSAEEPAPRIPSFVATTLKNEAIRTNASCPISMEPFTDIPTSITSCFHLFDRTSIDTWLKKDTSCPVCKSQVAFVQAV